MRIRPLRLSSPHLRGEDVKALQRSLNKRLEARGRRKVTVDGDYGRDTAGAVRKVAYLLGCDLSTLEKGATVGVQAIIHDPSKRTPAQLARAGSRVAYLEDGNREVADVLAWCHKQVGTVEHPANSNRGPKIDVWQREFHMRGQPWCGAFVGYALRRIGAVPVGDFVVYTPAILAHARAGTGGFERLVAWKDRRRGDLVLMNFSPGGDPVEHVGIYDAGGVTIEGNTSQGTGGSQSNGGGVFKRKRSADVVVGCARPRF